MAISGVLRPGYVQLRVLDMKEALQHYRDRIGLDVVATGDDGRVYLKTYDEFDHHSIVLRPADEAGMDYLGFKVASEDVLDGFRDKLIRAGLEVIDVPAGEQPGLGRRVAFIAPTGHRIELYATIEKAEHSPMVTNPDLWHAEPRGMKPIRFDHCLIYGDEVDATAEIFTDILGFSLTEQVLTPDGTKVAIFLSCSTKAHDIAMVRFEGKNKLHHCSFLLESWNDIGHAADIMTRYNMSVDIGPTRHGITRGQTIYFFDPSGNRNEVFCGGYAFYPDNPVRTWHTEEVGKAIFYYERALNDRFMTVVT